MDLGGDFFFAGHREVANLLVSEANRNEVPLLLVEPDSRPWRRHLRFSVRGPIVLTLIIGGWLGSKS
jgi:hypothetical protein